MAVGSVTSTSVRSKVITFSEFRADLGTGELWKRNAPVKLQDQPFRMLAILLENAGHVVSKEELRQRLWPGDTYVNFDVGLNSCAKRLRQALGDSAETPVFFETMSRRGYRWIAPIEVTQTEAAAPASLTALPATPQAQPMQLAAAGGVMAVPDAAKLGRLVLVLSSAVVVLLIVLLLDVLLLHGH